MPNSGTMTIIRLLLPFLVVETVVWFAVTAHLVLSNGQAQYGGYIGFSVTAFLLLRASWLAAKQGTAGAGLRAGFALWAYHVALTFVLGLSTLDMRVSDSSEAALVKTGYAIGIVLLTPIVLLICWLTGRAAVVKTSGTS